MCEVRSTVVSPKNSGVHSTLANQIPDSAKMPFNVQPIIGSLIYCGAVGGLAEALQ
jgi:hypothetical protein